MEEIRAQDFLVLTTFENWQARSRRMRIPEQYDRMTSCLVVHYERLFEIRPIKSRGFRWSRLALNFYLFWSFKYSFESTFAVETNVQRTLLQKCHYSPEICGMFDRSSILRLIVTRSNPEAWASNSLQIFDIFYPAISAGYKFATETARQNGQ